MFSCPYISITFYDGFASKVLLAVSQVPHNGDCGCSTCNIKSVTVKLGKGHSNAYLFEDYKTTTQRTAESFRQDAELANETGEKVNIIKLLLK